MNGDRITVRLGEDGLADLRQDAERNGWSISDQVRQDRYLARLARESAYGPEDERKQALARLARALGKRGRMALGKENQPMAAQSKAMAEEQGETVTVTTTTETVTFSMPDWGKFFGPPAESELEQAEREDREARLALVEYDLDHPDRPAASYRARLAAERLERAKLVDATRQREEREANAWGGYVEPDFGPVVAKLQALATEFSQLIDEELRPAVAAAYADWDRRRRAAEQKSQDAPFERPRLPDGWDTKQGILAGLLRAPRPERTFAGPRKMEARPSPAQIKQHEAACRAWHADQERLYWATETKQMVQPPAWDWARGAWTQEGPDSEQARMEQARTGVTPEQPRERTVISLHDRTQRQEAWRFGGWQPA